MIAQKKIFDGKKCVVTGGTGFIGSHLCSKLLSLGADVISVDIEEPNDGTFHKLLNGNKNIQTLVADLSDPYCISQIVELDPNHIFHLAGLPYAPYTSTHPVSAFRSNVASTTNMLEVARIASVDRFTLASSACVFGATMDSPIPVDGRRCKAEHYYTYTKRQAENAVESFSEFYNISSSICRFVNIYGPGDRHFGRLIPALCKQLVDSSPRELTLFRSSGESIFEFLYVEDAVLGLVASSLDSRMNCSVDHYGPGSSARIRTADLAQRLSLLFDKRDRHLVTKATGGERTVNKYLDVSDTMDNTGWNPKWNFEDGLSETINWYRSNIDDIRPFNYSFYDV